MNEQNWITEMNHKDTIRPKDLGPEIVYTVSMKDLFQMPEVDFSALALMDPDIRALFN